MPEVDGNDLAILVLSLAVTALDAIAQAGATPPIKDVFIVEFRTGERVGFWATCRMTGSACTQIMNESPNTPSGALHNLLVARYFLLASSILFGIITLVAVMYVFSERELADDPSFLRFFKPVSVLALLVQGAVSLTVSTLIRALQNGSIDGTDVIRPSGVNILEVLLWVAFGAVFATMLVTLGFRGVLGSE